ncbi:hypothetical protein [Streptomyces antibioticus]|uniref:hypothetical protein n=1 Tax=Streptomyces antibioticus TaxID=1890 RepID=UPI0036D928CC
MSLNVLRRRCEADKGCSWVVDGHDFLAHWLDDPGARLVATRTVHTGGESPGQIAGRLI